MIPYIALKLILLIHVMFLLFMIGVPFIPGIIHYWLLMHSMLAPFIMIHWLLNDNTCFFTMVERYIRREYFGQDKVECFTCRIVNPIYDFKNNHYEFRKLLYVTTIILWIISTCRLIRRWRRGEIESFQDLLLV